MGKALAVFTFSPRGPRIPEGPWWTQKKKNPTYAMSHYILYWFRLSTGWSHIKISGITALWERTRPDEGLVYNLRKTFCPCEEQLLYNNKRKKDLCSCISLYAFHPGELQLLKSTALKEILKASAERLCWRMSCSWVADKKRNKTWYFTVGPLSPSKPARPSSP